MLPSLMFLHYIRQMTHGSEWKLKYDEDEHIAHYLKHNWCLLFTSSTLPLLETVILQKIFSWKLLQWTDNSDIQLCLQYWCRHTHHNNKNHRFTAIIQVNLHRPAPKVKIWRISLVQSFTVRMPLLTATSTCALGRRCSRVSYNVSTQPNNDAEYVVVWPTMSCFADWSKRHHVTFVIIESWSCRQSTVQHFWTLAAPITGNWSEEVIKWYCSW